MNVFKRLLGSLLLSLMVLSTVSCHTQGDEPLPPQKPNGELARIIASTYPEEAVTVIAPSDVEKRISEIASGTDYSDNKGTMDTGLYASPYLSVTANDISVPVYAFPAFSLSLGTGVLHSFSEIEMMPSETQEDTYIELTLSTNPLLTENGQEAKCISSIQSAENLDCYVKDGVVTLYLTEAGSYTFFVTLDDESTAGGHGDERYVYTLIVREYVDEDAEIAALKAKYPVEYFAGVTVYEAGIHYIDPIILQETSGAVIYLKRGAMLIAKHQYDLNTAEDDHAHTKATIEAEKKGNVFAELNRLPVIGINNASHVEIAGRGMLNLSMLDMGERNGIYITYSQDIAIRGLTVLNPSITPFFFYRCGKVTITDTAVLGYRHVSADFAIYNSNNIQIERCFSRSSGNCFSVGTMTGTRDKESETFAVRFTDCRAWSEGGSCYEIAESACKTISDVVFEASHVILHYASDNERHAALSAVISLTEDDTVVDDIHYRDITVFREYHRAILCSVYRDVLEECSLNVVFDTIVISSQQQEEGVIKLDAKSERNTITADLHHIRINGTMLTADRIAAHIIQNGQIHVNVRNETT